MIFGPALAEMTAAGSPTYGPEPFQTYVGKHFPGLHTRTADVISVDDPKRLRPELLAAGAMVLRMGQQSAGITDFAIVRPEGGNGSYFIDDSDLEPVPVTTFLSRSSQKDLFVFELLPRHVEASLINLALVSGLLSEALELDAVSGLPAPAGGSSTYTFPVRPHSSLDVTWQHNAGQVEIDALFLAERKGKDVLFVLEAKVGMGERRLAKHKLVYPTLGLATRVPRDIQIVPVYLKISADPSGIHATVVECFLPDPRISPLSPPAIDELKPERVARLRFPIPVGQGTI